MNTTLLIFFLVTLIILVITVSFTNLSNPILPLLVVVILIENNGDTCSIIDALTLALCVDIFILDISAKVSDLLDKAVQLSKELIRNWSHNFFTILLAFGIQNTIGLDR